MPEQKQKVGGAPTATKKPHEKTQAREAISAERKGNGDKYSVESLRANMSTGGGTPIEKGKKWTTEHRVLQPRDPDTGHFTYNADAQYGLKYKQRAKGAVPIGAKDWVLNGGIKKGDKVNINDQVWIAIDSINKDDVIAFFKKYDEEKGEYYTKKDDESDLGPFDRQDNGKGEAFSSHFIRKRGRTSNAEKEGMDNGDRILGNVNLASLGKYSQAEMKQKFQQIQNGFNISQVKLGTGIAKIGGAQLAANTAHNAAVNAARQRAAAAATAARMSAANQAANQAKPAYAGAGAGAGAPATSAPSTPKPSTPTTPAPTAPTKPSTSSGQANVGKSQGTIPFQKGQLPNKASLSAALSKFKKSN